MATGVTNSVIGALPHPGAALAAVSGSASSAVSSLTAVAGSLPSPGAAVSALTGSLPNPAASMSSLAGSLPSPSTALKDLSSKIANPAAALQAAAPSYQDMLGTIQSGAIFKSVDSQLGALSNLGVSSDVMGKIGEQIQKAQATMSTDMALAKATLAQKIKEAKAQGRELSEAERDACMAPVSVLKNLQSTMSSVMDNAAKSAASAAAALGLPASVKLPSPGAALGAVTAALPNPGEIAGSALSAAKGAVSGAITTATGGLTNAVSGAASGMMAAVADGMPDPTAAINAAASAASSFAASIPSATIPNPEGGEPIPNPEYEAFMAIPGNASKVAAVGNLASTAASAGSSLLGSLTSAASGAAAAAASIISTLKADAFLASLTKSMPAELGSIVSGVLNLASVDPFAAVKAQQANLPATPETRNPVSGSGKIAIDPEVSIDPTRNYDSELKKTIDSLLKKKESAYDELYALVGLKRGTSSNPTQDEFTNAHIKTRNKFLETVYTDRTYFAKVEDLLAAATNLTRTKTREEATEDDKKIVAMKNSLMDQWRESDEYDELDTAALECDTLTKMASIVRTAYLAQRTKAELLADNPAYKDIFDVANGTYDEDNPPYLYVDWPTNNSLNDPDKTQTTTSTTPATAPSTSTTPTPTTAASATTTAPTTTKTDPKLGTISTNSGSTTSTESTTDSATIIKNNNPLRVRYPDGIPRYSRDGEEFTIRFINLQVTNDGLEHMYNRTLNWHETAFRTAGMNLSTFEIVKRGIPKTRHDYSEAQDWLMDNWVRKKYGEDKLNLMIRYRRNGYNSMTDAESDEVDRIQIEFYQSFEYRQFEKFTEKALGLQSSYENFKVALMPYNYTLWGEDKLLRDFSLLDKPATYLACRVGYLGRHNRVDLHVRATTEMVATVKAHTIPSPPSVPIATDDKIQAYINSISIDPSRVAAGN